MRCRLEDAIAAKQDDIVRLQAKQAMSEKAVQSGAVQVTQLQGALQDQAESLESSEAAREAVQVIIGTDTEDCIPVAVCKPCLCM